MRREKTNRKKQSEVKEPLDRQIEAVERERRIFLREMLDPYWSWRFARANGA
jgi:hypothetical protein